MCDPAGSSPQADALLQRAIAQARALGIPVSHKIAPQVRINTRAKKRFGCCIGTVREGFVIELAAALLPCEEKAVLQTLAHEVLHTCRGCQNHQALWQSYAAAMNRAYGYAISRTSRPELLGLESSAPQPVYRWRIRCLGCGRVFYRQRASALTQHPENYRCSRCGGRLEPEEIPVQKE